MSSAAHPCISKCRSRLVDFSRNNTAGFAVPLSLTLKKITAQFSSLRRELIQQATQRADSRLLKAILEPTVIDIGAASYGPISSHDGSDALLLLMQLHDVHGAQVHGFEIQPRKAQALVEEAKRLRRRMHLLAAEASFNVYVLGVSDVPSNHHAIVGLSGKRWRNAYTLGQVGSDKPVTSLSANVNLSTAVTSLDAWATKAHPDAKSILCAQRQDLNPHPLTRM